MVFKQRGHVCSRWSCWLACNLSLHCCDHSNDRRSLQYTIYFLLHVLVVCRCNLDVRFPMMSSNRHERLFFFFPLLFWKNIKLQSVVAWLHVWSIWRVSLVAHVGTKPFPLPWTLLLFVCPFGVVLRLDVTSLSTVSWATKTIWTLFAENQIILPPTVRCLSFVKLGELLILDIPKPIKLWATKARRCRSTTCPSSTASC